MGFELVRYYDTCCDICGNWASGDFSPADIGATKKEAEEFLLKRGWKRIKDMTYCNYCVKGERRFTKFPS